LNLGLEVIGKRQDGFHEIATILQTTSLFDRLSLTAPGTGRILSDDREMASESNLIAVASSNLAVRLGRSIDVDFLLEKRIPVGAGLGGGSSDAALALRMLCHLWNMPPSSPEIAAAAAAAGSDVPFFLTGGRAVARGRGEELTLLDRQSPCWALLLIPPIAIGEKTARLYRALQPSDFSDGSEVELRAEAPMKPGMAYRNAFARPLSELLPELVDAIGQVEEALSRPLSISGAGPAHFLPAANPEDAIRLMGIAKAALNSAAWHYFIVRSTAGYGPVRRNSA
jgi:4-diphosphocytidyl-2-C-methyl-D-erythritol kinase